MERHRRRRAGAARRLDRPQRARRVGPDHLRTGRGRFVRLRHQSRERERVPLQGRLGSHARDRGHDSRKGREARSRRAEVHAPRSRGVRRPREPQGLRPARGMDGTGRRAVPRQPPHEPGDELGGIPRGVQLQPHAVGEHGVGRSRGPHRLAGRRHPADPPQLERAAARARRWPLRVGRLPADQGAAVRSGPRARVHRHRQQLPAARHLSLQGPAPLHVDRRLPRVEDHGGARLRTAVQHRGDDAAAERRRVGGGAGVDAVAEGHRVLEPGECEGARPADGVELRARQRLGRRRRLCDVPAPPAREHARGGRARGGAGGGPQPGLDQAPDRLAALARPPLRRQPGDRPRRPGGPQHG